MQNELTKAPLVIVLAYIIVGHAKWRNAEIRIFVYIASGEVEEVTRKVSTMIQESRLPMSPHNLTAVLRSEEYSMESAVALSAFRELNDVLFVRACKTIPIG